MPLLLPFYPHDQEEERKWYQLTEYMKAKYVNMLIVIGLFQEPLNIPWKFQSLNLQIPFKDKTSGQIKLISECFRG